MKKVLQSALFLILFSVFSFQTSFAQVAASPSATPVAVDYTLPYPGILPDNPLYFVKALRDQVVSFFISDPLKKAQFDLLMSDVRLNAATYLFAKGESKYSLAETTISKGENYFYNSLQQIQSAKQQGMDVNDTVSKLVTASMKHQEVITGLMPKTSGDVKQRLTIDLQRAKDLEKTAQGLKSK
jgi:Domain of unknown function (DUF5667)